MNIYRLVELNNYAEHLELTQHYKSVIISRKIFLRFASKTLTIT